MSAASQTASRARRPVALVTGAARRVGLATARALAGAGCDLIITYNRSDSEARQTAAELAALGAAVRLQQVDLDDPAGVEREAARINAECAAGGGLDILVHNASTYDPTPLGTFTPDQALRAFRVNALAPLLLSRHLAPLLARSPMPGGGAIVAMADIHALGEHGLPRRRDFIAYAMSKAALVEMVRTLARELAPRVRVNAVAPGVVAWPESGRESGAEGQREYLKRVPLERPGTPEDAAAAVKFLALEAPYVTGQVLRVDGGRSLM